MVTKIFLSIAVLAIPVFIVMALALADKDAMRDRDLKEFTTGIAGVSVIVFLVAIFLSVVSTIWGC